ncbi:MAG: hypothetical protein R3C20_14920 [Planctomycetaceae bacterium]
MPRSFVTMSPLHRSEFAPPYSFLILSLLLAGIGIRLGVAFFQQPVDHTVLSRLASTVKSVSLEDVFVLTVPSIILVAMAGAGVARWTAPKVKLPHNPVVRCVCLCAGLQFIVVGFCCLGALIIKALSGTSMVLPGNLFDQITATGLLLLILTSTRPLYHTIRKAGSTRLAGNPFAVMLLSFLATTSVLVGVAIVNAISFDLGQTIAEARQRHQHQILSDVYVAARTLSSRMTRVASGAPAIEMNLALVNVSEEPVLLPRPFELEHAVDPRRTPFQLLTTAVSEQEAGLVLQPGETRIVNWTLSIPEWCSDPKVHQTPLPVTFHCFPYVGTDDMLNIHPIGESRLVYAELQWPMSEAWRMLDREKIQRTGRMISESRDIR